MNTNEMITSYGLENNASRKALHVKSQERVKQWNNTMLGNRKNKLEERARKNEIDEIERLRLDAVFLAESVIIRNTAIEKAKLQIFREKDVVRALHTQINKLKAIEERDIQSQLNFNRRFTGDSADEKLFSYVQKLDKDFEMREMMRIDGKKCKEKELASYVDAQRKEKTYLKNKQRNVRVLLTQELVAERKQILKEDAEFRLISNNLDSNRHEASKKVKAELDNYRDEVKERSSKLNNIERGEDALNNAWNARKAKQTLMKNEREKKMFV